MIRLHNEVKHQHICWLHAQLKGLGRHSKHTAEMKFRLPKVSGFRLNLLPGGGSCSWTKFVHLQSFSTSDTSASSRFVFFVQREISQGFEIVLTASKFGLWMMCKTVQPGWNPCDPRFQVQCFWILNVFDTVWLKMAQMNFTCTGSESSHAFRYASFPGSRSIEEGEGHRVLVSSGLSVTSWSQDNVWDVFGLVSH